MTETRSSGRKRNGKIELLRFVFAMVVLMTHSKLFSPSDRSLIMPRGELGVEFFLIVSGYLMAVSAYGKRDIPVNDLGRETGNFLWRKIKAICPEYYLAWVISFVVMNAFYWKSATAVMWIKRFLSCIWEWFFVTMAGFGSSRANGVAWYISAMLMVMLVLYPMIRKNFDLFVRVVAPALAIAIIGRMCYTTGTPSGVYKEYGLAYKGLVRTLGEICLGAALFPLIQSLTKAKLTKAGHALVTVVETGCWLCVLAYIQAAPKDKFDFVVVLLIAVGVCLSFSHQGMFADRFDNAVCGWLGKMSLSIYFSHAYWGRAIGKNFPGVNYYKLLVLYVAVALVNALILHYLSDYLRKKHFFSRFMGMFVLTERGEKQ